MASPSVSSPPPPALHRDIRSASKPFKRDKDHTAKWMNGTRPSAGVREVLTFTCLPEDENDKWIGGSASQRAKVRPDKPWGQSASFKTHANKTPKPTSKPAYDGGWASNRMSRKIDAQVEATSSPDISRSLMDLMPHHVPNTSSIQTVVYAPDNEGAFTSSEATATKKGRATGLGGLVAKAEERFIDEQTERMVKEDYEVLDVEGERIALKAEKKRKASPKQKAKTDTQLAEEDGFELI